MSFKHILLASASIIAINGATLAADLPSKTKPAPFVAAPAFSWAGLYVGAHGGFASFKPNYTEPAASQYDTNPSVTGGVFGALAGYNFQSANIVWGGEADFGFGTHSKLSNTASNNYSKFTMPWNGHLRARLGYAMGETLFFVAAGAAFAQFNTDDIQAYYGHFNQTRVGWTVGAGVEHAITKNWIARVEYLYDSYAGKTSLVPFDGGKGSSYDANIKPDMHTVRAALVYKF